MTTVESAARELKEALEDQEKMQWTYPARVYDAAEALLAALEGAKENEKCPGTAQPVTAEKSIAEPARSTTVSASGSCAPSASPSEQSPPVASTRDYEKDIQRLMQGLRDTGASNAFGPQPFQVEAALRSAYVLGCVAQSKESPTVRPEPPANREAHSESQLRDEDRFTWEQIEQALRDVWVRHGEEHRFQRWPVVSVCRDVKACLGVVRARTEMGEEEILATVECCVQCLSPKVPAEKSEWTMCANTGCVAYGEAKASAAYRRGVVTLTPESERAKPVKKEGNDEK